MLHRKPVLAGLLAFTVRAALAQVPPEERIPVLDPDRLQDLGFPRDAKNVYLWSKADLKGTSGAEAVGRRPDEVEEWGSDAAYTTILGSELRLYDHLWSNARYGPSTGFFLMTSGQVFPAAGYARVHLPLRAELKQIKWWLRDDSAEEDSRFSLLETCQHVGFDNPITTVIAEGQTFGAPGNWFSFNTIDYRPAANSLCGYEILVGFGHRSVGADLRFYKATLVWSREVRRAPTLPTFGDVPTNHLYFRSIEALAASGVSQGCGSGNFCPNGYVTRGEMAAFLARALGL